MIVAIADELDGDVLDVGCGEGLLVERLAKVSRSVIGVDRDRRAINLARARTAALRNTTLLGADFIELDLAPESFDLVTFVAVLHHMDLDAALHRARELLRPGGRLVVVGLSANKSVGDYLRSAALLPLIRVMSRMHHETRSVPLVALPPKESFSEIRQMAQEILPGVRLRRALYYRYVLSWRKAPGMSAIS